MKKIGINTSEIIYDYYSRPSPTACWKLRLISVYCMILFSISLVLNGVILYAFRRSKKLRTPVNMLVLVFTVLSFIASCTEAPFVIVSNFRCRWTWGKLGCFVSGFIMYAIASVQILLMAAISLERFIVIFKPTSISQITLKNIWIVIGICTFLGVFCAIVPLFGWSYYSMEGSLTSCSVEWAERSFSVISYNIFIFILTYVIPVIVICISNFRLLFIVKQLPKHNVTTKAEQHTASKRDSKERSLTIIMMTYIVAFIASWTPYAVVTFYAAFIADDLPPLAGTLPAMFAKSAFVWSSAIFLYSSKAARKALFGMEDMVSHSYASGTRTDQQSRGNETYGKTNENSSGQGQKSIETPHL